MIAVILLVLFMIVLFWPEREPDDDGPGNRAPAYDENDPGPEMVIGDIWEDYERLERVAWYTNWRDEVGMSHEEIKENFPFAAYLEECREEYEQARS